MQALLLAAGRSRRFQPLGDKNFFSVGGKFLIEHSVANLKKAGVKKIIFVANAGNEKSIRGLFPKDEVLVQKNLDEGMAGAVLAAKKFLAAPTLIASTNDFVEAAAIKKVLAAKSCDGSILAQRVEKYFPGGYLKIGKGKIFNIVEKPHPDKTPSRLINLVFHFFRDPKTLLAELTKTSNKNDDGYELALASLFKKQKFVAVENPGKWLPLKFPWHALDLVADFLSTQKSKISAKAKIAKTAVVENSLVEAGARILDFAIVRNSYIAEDALVGSHSLVRDSQILANAVVGSHSEVARSSLGENSWLHRNYIGDSVITENVSFGSGAVCANLRLDEEEVCVEIEDRKTGTGRNKFGCAIGADSRIGVNSSIMPGVLVGRGCFVGSGVVVSKNLKTGSFLDTSCKNDISENKKSAPERGKALN
ncbi:MAG: NTP transferase domain-containing protein [Candidatus Peribacteraceae bacterium]|nr:NTP transferase domain-containing protein [Candidatus Peribacteraceae bacterium]